MKILFHTRKYFPLEFRVCYFTEKIVDIAGLTTWNWKLVCFSPNNKNTKKKKNSIYNFAFFCCLFSNLQSLESQQKSPLREKDDLVIFCTAQGSTQTTFSWYKNGFLLNVSKSIRLVSGELFFISLFTVWFTFFFLLKIWPLFIWDFAIGDWKTIKLNSIYCVDRTFQFSPSLITKKKLIVYCVIWYCPYHVTHLVNDTHMV